MTTTAPSTEVVLAEPAATERERLALAGFLAGYSGLTRDSYALDLRQFMRWCSNHGTHLFAVRRADIECFGRDLEAKGRSRSTVSRRLCTVAGFYRYAVEEELLEHSPALHVRRPRVDYESHATALDRNEVGALLVAGGLGPAAEHALISLLALNGLRVSEATGANIAVAASSASSRGVPHPRRSSSRSARSTRPATAAALAWGTVTARDLSNGQSAAGKACSATAMSTTASTTSAPWSAGHGADARRPGMARVTIHATPSSSPCSTTSGTGAPWAASHSILAASPLSWVPRRPWGIETLA